MSIFTFKSYEQYSITLLNGFNVSGKVTMVYDDGIVVNENLFIPTDRILFFTVL